MTMLYGIVLILIIVFGYLVFQTISGSTREATNFPLEEDEHHLFAERPYPHESEKSELDTKASKIPVSQKDLVMAHLMVHGTISKNDALKMGIKRLPMIILRLRKLYKIDNVIVDGKFSHYKLIEYKGN